MEQRRLLAAATELLPVGLPEWRGLIAQMLAYGGEVWSTSDVRRGPATPAPGLYRTDSSGEFRIGSVP